MKSTFDKNFEKLMTHSEIKNKFWNMFEIYLTRNRNPNKDEENLTNDNNEGVTLFVVDLYYTQATCLKSKLSQPSAF